MKRLVFISIVFLFVGSFLFGYDVAEDGLIRDLHYSMDIFEDTDYDDQNFVGWAVHTEYDWPGRFFGLIRNYEIMGSNWFFRDTNSVFIRRPDMMEQRSHMYPGITVEELNELHEEHPVLWYQQYPSLMWVSVRSLEDFEEAFTDRDGRFFHAIDRLAYNQYEDGSWFNITGSSLNIDVDMYEEALNEHRYFNYSTGSNSTNESLPWEYDHIDYSNPDLYLEQGDRSDLDEKYVEWVVEELGHLPHTSRSAYRIMNWVSNNFEPGGPGDWRATVNEYFHLGLIEACNEQSLIIASVFRALGFPAIHINTVDMDVAAHTELGEGIDAGHAMVEVYIEEEERWILIEGFGRMETDYDPTDPYIPMDGENPFDSSKPWRLFVFAKGLDHWDTGIFNDDDLHRIHDVIIENLRAGNLDEYFDSDLYDMDDRS